MNLLSNYPTEILILVFLIVTFLQSGIDKLLDWNGNVSFIKEHFKNSPLKNKVPFLLGIILLIEIIASVLMIFGIYKLYVSGEKEMALLGVELCAITLIFLLIGQRLAKDYAGAMSLTVYFILTVFGVFLLHN
ncbi:MAG: DoxX family membrane protein [Flavobacteriia bacterium]|nr:DoxX family membrane protein [Flavobacteriia bacterium]OIP45541.1 MAG: DoxX family protein [Flavobacteriaceae bacterium CG2_30_31_66]PIV96795.1 MAG: DoxX family protein [Flavobacteriaceae bacterium CG17_big_fil_post_rev_8_21_14_2_50_31_13]PIX11994.1 MAG: DoxX family protein [Flavobacteriaceae bacterium CG_4_8_14_3_um_filter_31_8]PIY14968.1 MAG: DoxX family protein [Flavobacteriaceae bacterium CG_4_10_14_3_um_filter_31_253]PIZ11660.1 MAG: DoxX family protein [Flavobacteriaceae bacterium CG_4